MQDQNCPALWCCKGLRHSKAGAALRQIRQPTGISCLPGWQAPRSAQGPGAEHEGMLSAQTPRSPTLHTHNAIHCIMCDKTIPSECVE